MLGRLGIVAVLLGNGSIEVLAVPQAVGMNPQDDSSRGRTGKDGSVQGEHCGGLHCLPTAMFSVSFLCGELARPRIFCFALNRCLQTRRCRCTSTVHVSSTYCVLWAWSTWKEPSKYARMVAEPTA